MNGNVVTIIVVVLSSVITFLLAQPAGTFPQGVIIVLGAFNVALTAISRFLPAQGQPIPVEITKVPDDPPPGG